MSSIKYIITDDHKIFRHGLKYALTDDPEIQYVGEAENGKELLELLKTTIPDVVLLDLKMPVMDGIEAVKQIRPLYPDVRILMLTSHDDEHFVLHLIELGANGYLIKNAEPNEIKKAIHSVYNHGFYFNELMNNAMLKKLATVSNPEKPQTYPDKTQEEKITIPVKLNDRETDVLKGICNELTTAQIAEQLYLSPRTIEGIRTSLIDKLGVKNVAGLVVYAIKNGIVE
jgi:DNA-binding NarL/FixJ family response regulator